VALLGAGLALAACGDGSSALVGTRAVVAVAKDRPGKSYRQQITSPIGDTVVFQVFEPKELRTGERFAPSRSAAGASRSTLPRRSCRARSA
jgi:hypothetical protein